jgi:hypothetical protein
MGTTSKKKGCPKNAFLGLCEEGLIKDVPRGSYTHSKKNKKYALDAVAILKRCPALATKPVDLWDKVTSGKVNPNQQMDVVISLWSSGLIV